MLQHQNIVSNLGTRKIKAAMSEICAPKSTYSKRVVPQDKHLYVYPVLDSLKAINEFGQYFQLFKMKHTSPLFAVSALFHTNIGRCIL